MKRLNLASWSTMRVIVACGAFALASCDDGPSVDQVEAPLKPRTRNCGTHEPNPGERARVQAEIDAFRAANRFSIMALSTTDVPVRVHVIKKADGTGALTPAQIQAQIDMLNTAYGGQDTFAWDGRSVSEPTFDTSFRFVLAGTTTTVNDTWFNAGIGSGAEAQMKAALRLGGPETLNVYTTSGGGYLGWATFPQDFPFFPEDDGVVIAYDSVPGVASWVYGYGDTLVHEAGHWLGLYHTFQGGCSGSGDAVEDTAAERMNQFGCPNPVPDTCSTKPGLDPIYNYMDYTDDQCMFVFTSGQDARMTDLWALYRHTAPACGTDAECDDGNACTTDTCDAGTCSHGTVTCPADGNSCTSDACDAGLGCAYPALANGAGCSDGNACTAGDSCQSGQCTAGGTVSCDDGNVCTDDACDTATGCTHADVDDGAVCDDGDACTSNDQCLTGTCGGEDICPDPTIHVGDLDRSTTGNNKNWQAHVTIRVHDDGHALVAGALVTGTWSSGGSGSCTTSAAGNCTVSRAGLKKPNSSIAFTVTSVSGGGATYEASQNHDPDGDSNGSSITVPRPP